MIKNIINEKIFLAGKSGMVGSAIYRALKKYPYEFEKHKKLLIPSRKELNLLDQKEVNEWFKSNKPSIVIIAAAKVGGIVANSTNPACFILENLKIQTNIIESSFRNNTKRLLFLGSSCIYPKFADQPIIEESLLTGRLEETNESYAIAKIAGIKLCQSLRNQYGFDAISLMPTNLYGPNDNYHPVYSHVMASLIRKFKEAAKNNYSKVTCWGTGSPLREFLHVDDLAEAVIFCLENWNPNANNSPKDLHGKPLNWLNVGTGEDISIKDLSEKIALISGFKGEIIWDTSKPDGTPRKLLSSKKINSLGWKAKINIDYGIKMTLENLKNFD